jgi:hypothetical protein
MNDIIDFLIIDGFEDVTDIKPIKLTEYIPKFTEDYELKSRWEKQENGLITEVLIGKEFNKVNIRINCRILRERKCDIQLHDDKHAVNFFKQYLDGVYQKISD